MMKKVNNFNDFLFDMIIEDAKKFHGVTELPFIISKRLSEFLQKINHPIAKRLLELNRDRVDKKVTLVDLSDKVYNKFSVVNSNKAYDNMVDIFKGADVPTPSKDDIIKTYRMMDTPNMSSDNDIWKNKSDVRIGSFIEKVLPKEFKQGGNPGNDIESFVQAVVAKRKSIEEGGDRFKLVKGEDIIKYYNVDNYDLREVGDKPLANSLQTSCMRYGQCASYINFYAQNTGVSLLILFSDNDGGENKIVGRAIVWELAEPSGRTFMDRIYYRYESDMALFKQYAEKEKWLYKTSQNMNANTQIYNPMTEEEPKTMVLRTISTFKVTQYFPYMDTMKYFNTNAGFLTNNEKEAGDDEDIYFLESTRGSYDYINRDREDDEYHDDQTFVEYYNEWIDDDDLIYCEFGEDYRLPADAILINDYDHATEDFIEDNMTYSEWMGRYLFIEDSVYSEYMEDAIPADDAVTLSDGADKNIEDVVRDEDDLRPSDHSSVITYYTNDIPGGVVRFDKEKYGEYFVYVQATPTEWAKEWVHKKWDKDKLYKHNGQWYYDFDGGKTRDKLTGQKRIFDDEKS